MPLWIFSIPWKISILHWTQFLSLSNKLYDTIRLRNSVCNSGITRGTRVSCNTVAVRSLPPRAKSSDALPAFIARDMSPGERTSSQTLPISSSQYLLATSLYTYRTFPAASGRVPPRFIYHGYWSYTKDFSDWPHKVSASDASIICPVGFRKLSPLGGVRSTVRFPRARGGLLTVRAFKPLPGYIRQRPGRCLSLC